MSYEYLKEAGKEAGRINQSEKGHYIAALKLLDAVVEVEVIRYHGKGYRSRRSAYVSYDELAHCNSNPLLYHLKDLFKALEDRAYLKTNVRSRR